MREVPLYAGAAVLKLKDRADKEVPSDYREGVVTPYKGVVTPSQGGCDPPGFQI